MNESERIYISYQLRNFFFITIFFSFLQWIDESAEEINNSVAIEVPISRAAGEEDAVTPPGATATMAPFPTDLADVFISVKTTRHYHRSRLPAIINTWFQFAKEQVSLLSTCSIK